MIGYCFGGSGWFMAGVKLGGYGRVMNGWRAGSCN